MGQNWHISVLGLGHVGLPTALGFAELGWSVTATDNDCEKARMVSEGHMPFFEPGVGELLTKHLASGRFRASCDVGEAVRQADILFICVGTPHREDGSADLSQVEGAARTIAENMNGYKLIVEKSTAPVHTARGVERAIKRYSKGDHEFDIACNPEFLREGTAMRDCLHPDRIVIGADSEKARERLQEFYKPFGCPMVVTDLNTAETIKHAANAFLALKISFINMVSDLCDSAGADAKDVATGIGLDPRIGPAFLHAGIGYGGFCLSKDLSAFMRVADDHGVSFALLKEVERVNDSRVQKFVRKIEQALWVIKDKRLAVWGLAFKANTDDIRDAPSLKIVRRLQKAGALLSMYDPQAIENVRREIPEEPDRLVYCSSALEAAKGAHAIVLLTEWAEFREMDLARLKETMAMPVIVDGRNCLDPARIEAAGFDYYGMGRLSRAHGKKG